MSNTSSQVHPRDLLLLDSSCHSCQSRVSSWEVKLDIELASLQLRTCTNTSTHRSSYLLGQGRNACCLPTPLFKRERQEAWSLLDQHLSSCLAMQFTHNSFNPCHARILAETESSSGSQGQESQPSHHAFVNSSFQANQAGGHHQKSQTVVKVILIPTFPPFCTFNTSDGFQIGHSPD